MCISYQKAGTMTCFFVQASLLGTSPTQTAMDWHWKCIFIIWLNCAWCAIRMEISPVRDDKYFMKVIWAEQFLICRRWAGFIFSHNELIESFRWGRQTAAAVAPPGRAAQGERFERDTRRLCPNGALCLTQLPRIHHPPCVSCLIMMWIYLSVCVSVCSLPFLYSWKRKTVFFSLVII